MAIMANRIAAFKGMSFLGVLKANEELGKPAIDAATRRNYFCALGGFVSWLVSREHIKEDVCAGLAEPTPKKARHKRRISFTTSQLNTLFASEIYSAPVAGWNYQQWLPVLALFSGARLGEMCQLLVSDVREIRGQWCMVITTEVDPEADEEDADDKSLKNTNSERIVPLHPEAMRLDFIDYHARMVAAGAPKLFPDIRHRARADAPRTG